MNRGRRIRGHGSLVGGAMAVTLIAGTFAGPPPAGAVRAVGCNGAWPVVAHRASGLVVQLPLGDRLPVACATETGYASSESSLAVTKDGALVSSPAETENSMARSLNGGASWVLT